MAGDVSKPTQRGGAADTIERALTDDISTGALEPGQRLDEVKLTHRFGVSRTPVREALNRLVAQGILTPGEKRGVRVTEYTREELAQIFEAMHEIEAACARVASQRLNLLSRSEIERAQASCVAAAEAGDVAGYLQSNEDFHDAIYKATGNPYLAQMAHDFRRRTGPFRAKKFYHKDALVASVKNHQVLIDSIFTEDSKIASDSMRAHMTESFMRDLAAN